MNRRHHTIGKWYVGHLPKGTTGCRDIKVKIGPHRQAQGIVIASTAGCHPDDVDAANAELMAAAPELLRMARVLAGYECARDSSCRGADKCGPCEARSIVRKHR